MSRLCVCGSFRFVNEMNELEDKLKEENIEYHMPEKSGSRQIVGCLEKIDEADVVYVVNPGGYIGKSVSLDIGYAYAKNKPIYVLHAICDPPIMNLTRGILSFEELVKFFKQGAKIRHRKKQKSHNHF